MLSRTFIAFVFIALALAFNRVPADAREIKLTISGEEKTIWSTPHQPYLTVTSLAELREHYQEVKDVLPPMPFLMEGQWVVPGSIDSFRTFPDDPLLEEYFSPNGDYIAQIEQRRGFVHGQRYSKRIRLMTVDGALLWEKQDGPIAALVTDAGCVIGRSQYNEPLSLTYYDREGQVFKLVQGVFTERNMPKTGHFKLVPQEKLILAWDVRQVVALSYEGEVLWRYTPPLEPVVALVGVPGFDPLGRGIYIPIHYRNLETSVLLFHAQSGAAQSFVWENKFIPISNSFLSPSGNILGIKTQSKIGLIDWRTGEILFWRDDLTGDELGGGRWEASFLADEPLRFAVSAAQMFVLNAEGKPVWECRISTGSSSNRLNMKGQKLSLSMVGPRRNANSSTDPFVGFILYRLDEG